MSRIERTKEMIETMQAFVNGSDIQTEAYGANTWYDSSNPLWNWETRNYRVKPKSELELCIEAEEEQLEKMKVELNLLPRMSCAFKVTQEEIDYKRHQIIGLRRALFLSNKA